MTVSDDLYQVAEAAATKAKAVYRCENHDDVLLSNRDPEADGLAYAIATNWAKERGIDRADMMKAIESVLGDAGFECPYPPCNPEAD